MIRNSQWHEYHRFGDFLSGSNFSMVVSGSISGIYRQLGDGLCHRSHLLGGTKNNL